MSCPSRHRLTAASAGEDVAAEIHALSCPRCSAELDAMTALVALARRAPAPTLSADRRARIRAAAMAAADAAPLARARRFAVRPWIASIAIAAAAAVLLAVTVRGKRDDAVPSRVIATSASPGSPGIAASPSTSPPSTSPPSAPPPGAPHPDVAPPAAVQATASDTSQPPHAPVAASPVPALPAPLPRLQAAREIPPLANGTATIDARNAAPVRVVTDDTKVNIASSKVEVSSRGGVVTMVRVFAGSAQIDYSGKRQVVVAGDVWVRPAEPAATASASLHAFEQGWAALRAGQYADAISAFDRARDPVVAEDAAFWAAIASSRAGDRASAARRLRDFTMRFPASMRADAARQALARLAITDP